MFISKISLPRRSFLRGVGTALALPLVDAMVPALSAMAQTPAKPVRRLGFIYLPNGVSMNFKGTNYWKPIGEGHPPQPQADDRKRLFKQSEDGVRVAERIFGAGHFLRPTFVEPYRCKNILIEGVTIKNAPFWVMHPTLCSNVTVRRVTVIGHGPNTDGCNPESSRDSPAGP